MTWLVLLGTTRVWADAPVAPEMGVLWGLAVDGQPVGTREVTVRTKSFGDEQVRFVESYTDLRLTDDDRKTKDVVFRQRLTANSQDGRPASFTSVTETADGVVELQARCSGSKWELVWTRDGLTKTLDIGASEVDLSTADLFDPEADRKISELTQAKVLVDFAGRTARGPVTPLGPSDLSIGGEILTVEGFEWGSDLGVMRFFYAANGFLVRYELPLAGARVTATMLGAAPRPLDDFEVPRPGTVEAQEL
jgi:hypothetical protein